MEVVGVAGSFVPFDSVFSEMKSTGFDVFSSYVVAVVRHRCFVIWCL